jgi:hypothetical protein
LQFHSGPAPQPKSDDSTVPAAAHQSIIRAVAFVVRTVHRIGFGLTSARCPELHDRAAPVRLPRSELRESPPLGGLGRAGNFHRILTMFYRASGYRWSP